MTAIGGRDRRFCCSTQTENVKHFAYRVVSDGTVQMLSGWVVASVIRHNACACASAAFLIGIISLSKDFKHIVFELVLNKERN